MTGIIGKLGSNFLVAAFIPSLWFVVFAQIIFAPLDPATGENMWALSTNIFEGEGIVTIILTLLIGFTLMGLNTFFYKLLEGYFFLEKIGFLNKRQYRKIIKRQLEYRRLDKLAERLVNQSKTESSYDQKAKLQNLAFQLRKKGRHVKAQYKQDYPTNAKGVLPTRFGNIMKAFELYSLENYGIDSVTIWPRLIYVMDPTYYKKVDQSNNGLAFIINCMVLSLVMAALCLMATVYQIYNEITGNIILDAVSWEYLFIAFVFLVGLSFFFYYASLPAAKQYGNLVRSSFDLFRFALLEHLRLKLPLNDREEHDSWQIISDFMALGDLEGKRDNFFYIHNRKQNRKQTQNVSTASGTLENNGSEKEIGSRE